MSEYNDMFMRDNMSDTGSTPAQGGLSHSPDIIPYGITPVQDPQKYFSENWDKDLGKDLIADMNNFIYLRAQNLFNGPRTAKLYLYYSKANLLMYPSVWKNNVIKTGDGNDFFEVSVEKYKDIAVAGTPDGSTFTWKPSMPSGTHYCLVGRVVTDDHPNPIPETGDIDNFSTYIATHPDIAWRNVVVTDKGTPTFSVDVDYEQGENPDGNSVDMHFILTCKNVPLGAEVSFNSPQSGPVPMVNLDKSKITNPDSQDLGMVSSVPSNWKGTITYNYWANGTTPPKGWQIDLHVVYFVNSDHAAYPHAKTVEELNIPHHLRAGIGPQKGVVLGSHRVIGQ